MASHQPKSKIPADDKRPRVTDVTRHRARARSLSKHRKCRRRSSERGPSPARASRREEGPERTEARPRHPNVQHSPLHRHYSPPRPRSRSRRRRTSRSPSNIARSRSSSPSGERRPARPPSFHTSRTTAHHRRHRHRSRSIESERGRSIRHSSRDRNNLRDSRGSSRISFGKAHRSEVSYYAHDRRRRDTSQDQYTSPEVSRTFLPSRDHRRRSRSIDSHAARRRSSLHSKPSLNPSPARKRKLGNDRNHEGDSRFVRQKARSSASPVERSTLSPERHRERVGTQQVQRHRASSSDSDGPSEKQQRLSPGRTRLELHKRSSEVRSPEANTSPAFKVRGRIVEDQPRGSRTNDQSPVDLVEPVSPKDSIGVSEMYQWQGGRGGSDQRHGSLGYQQNNRGGWQGYQGSPPHGYSPQQQQQQQYQQTPNGGPQGGYNQQQFGGSPQSNHHQQNFAPRGGSVPMSRGAGAFGGRGSFRGAYQQSATMGPGGFSGSGPPTRGAAHFSNLSWTPQTGSRGGHAPIDKSNSIPAPSLPSSMAKSSDAAETSDDDDNPFRPSKELRVEDQSAKKEKEKIKALEEARGATQAEGRPRASSGDRSASGPNTEPTGPKFSFTLKNNRTESQASTGPKADLLQRPPQAPAASSNLSYRDRRFEQQPPPRAGDHREEFRQPQRPPRDPWVGRHADETRGDSWAEQRDEDQSGASDFRPTGFSLEYKTDKKEKEQTAANKKEKQEQQSSATAKEAKAGDKPPTDDVEMRDAPKPPPEPKKKYRKVMVKKLKEKPVMPEQWKKSSSVYYRDEAQDIVGSGTYGKVYKAVNVYTTEVVALKRIRMEGEKDGYPTTAVREIRILQAGSKSLNIVGFLEIMIENNECYMVFEYVEHDLTGLLNNPEFTLSAAHKKDLCRQLYAGIHFCHQNSILHRDIKAANILVTNKGILKIADFGLARIYDKGTVHAEDPADRPPYTNRVVTIWYRSPELCLGEVYYSTSVDVWSCACVMMEVYTKGAIFPGDGTEMAQYHKIASILGKPTPEIWPALRDMDWYTVFWPAKNSPRIFEEKYADKMSPGCLELLSSIFQWDPEKRPSAGEILDHPFFTQEEPEPQQAVELAQLKGDWHEYESKKVRKERELKEREERHKAKEDSTNQQQQQQQQQQQASQEAEDAGKRKAGSPVDVEIEVKKAREELAP